MNLLPKQKIAIGFIKDNLTKEIVYGGAAGGGKSALGCLWIIESCQKYQNSRWLIGRSKLKSLKETTLNTFFELSTKLEISNQFNYNSQNGTINWINGSQIILKDLFHYPSDPNYDSLGSLEITGAFVDECNQITYKAWQIVKSRCRYKLNEFGLIPKVLGTCNPSKNWVYNEFYKPKQKQTERVFIQSLPLDNPFLPKSYLESLLSLDKNSKERLYYGNWEYDDDPSALISYDAIQDYFNPIHLIRSNDMHLTIDVARKGKDKTVFRVWDGFICIKRLTLDVSKVNEVVDLAKKLIIDYKIPLSMVIADEDGVGGGVVDYLKCKGFINNSKATNPAYVNLKTECSVLMAKKINDRECGEICYDNEVITIVSEELEQIKYKHIDKDGKIEIQPKELIKEKIGRSPDDWDSIMMRMYFEVNKRTGSIIR